MSRHPPEMPPLWACAYGDDRYGLFADLRVDLVKQRFRWISPGRFLMGSPETEPGRLEREGPQHEVILTRGFWLANTACSQAFWLAVVRGENPSHFTGSVENPVEQVSWEEVMQRFVRVLQRCLETGVVVDLPTEAEWEYACRAGTRTPFHFGETLPTNRANFDRHFDYRHLRGTLQSNALEPNIWGLHQMHGNVWEWCRDGLRQYQERSSSDPLGPQEAGGLRALRGGAWIDDARSLRAAYRNRAPAGYRGRGIGFRFVLRSGRSSRR